MQSKVNWKNKKVQELLPSYSSKRNRESFVKQLAGIVIGQHDNQSKRKAVEMSYNHKS